MLSLYVARRYGNGRRTTKWTHCWTCVQCHRRQKRMYMIEYHGTWVDKSNGQNVLISKEVYNIILIFLMWRRCRFKVSDQQDNRFTEFHSTVEIIGILVYCICCCSFKSLFKSNVVLCIHCVCKITDRCSDKQSQGQDTAGTSSQSLGQPMWVDRTLGRQVSLLFLSITSC